MRLRLLLLFTLTVLYSNAQAQLLEAPIAGNTDPERFGKQETVEFRVGAEITASRGACKDIRAMVAIPLDCDEQRVVRMSEEFSRHVDRVTYRDLDGGAKQMLITVPSLAAGETATAVVTFEVTTNTIDPPRRRGDGQPRAT